MVKFFLFVSENLSKDWLVKIVPQTWTIIELSFIAKHIHPFFTVAVMKMVLSNYGEWRIKALK